MDAELRFDDFVRDRDELNLRIDISRRDLNAWVNSHWEGQADDPDLARLLQLLGERRELFSRLIQVDDELAAFLGSGVAERR